MNHVGKVGERRTFTATVIKSFTFVRSNLVTGNRETVWVTTMTEDVTNVLLVVSSTAFGATAGDHLTFNATIKKHGYHVGLPATIIQRIKLKR